MLLFTPLLAGGDYNIFELKGRISVWQVSLFLVVLLGITIVIEYFIHSLEHQFRHHIHYLKVTAAQTPEYIHAHQ